MTWSPSPESERGTALHRLLQRLSGRAPDELICTAREWLADGRETEAARAVAFGALAGGLRVSAADALLLSAALRNAGPGFAFVPQLAGPEEDDQLLISLRPAGASSRPHEVDAVDRAAIAEASGADVRGLWRAWRMPALRTPYPRPKRLYLLRIRTGPVAITARLQRALEAAGEESPLVEAFTEPEELPPFLRRALACAAPLPPADVAAG